MAIVDLGKRVDHLIWRAGHGVVLFGGSRFSVAIEQPPHSLHSPTRSSAFYYHCRARWLIPPVAPVASAEAEAPAELVRRGPAPSSTTISTRTVPLSITR